MKRVIKLDMFKDKFLRAVGGGLITVVGAASTCLGGHGWCHEEPHVEVEQREPVNIGKFQFVVGVTTSTISPFIKVL